VQRYKYLQCVVIAAQLKSYGFG